MTLGITMIAMGTAGLCAAVVAFPADLPQLSFDAEIAGNAQQRYLTRAGANSVTTGCCLLLFFLPGQCRGKPRPHWRRNADRLVCHTRTHREPRRSLD